MYTFNTRPV